jgi:hypothetical protein
MELMQVYKEPKRRKEDTEGRNLALAAATMGLVAAAGPLGMVPAYVGYGAGAAGAGAGLYGMLRQTPKQPQQESQTGYSESAVSRRLKASMDPMAELEQARNALTNLDLPEDIKIEYERPINLALERYQGNNRRV